MQLDLWNKDSLSAALALLSVIFLLTRLWSKLRKLTVPTELKLDPARLFAAFMIALAIAFVTLLLMIVSVEPVSTLARILASGVAAIILIGVMFEEIGIHVYEFIRRIQTRQDQLEEAMNVLAIQNHRLEQVIAGLEAKKSVTTDQKQLPTVPRKKRRLAGLSKQKKADRNKKTKQNTED